MALSAAAVAGLCAVAVWALWRVFVAGSGRWVDQLAIDGAQRGRGRLWSYAQQVLDPLSSVFYGAVGLVVVVSIAVLRRRWRLALLGALVLGAPVATTQVLKRVLLTRPALGDGLAVAPNSLPSGHTTAAAATCAALLFVVGPRWRPVVAVAGAAYTVLTGWSTYVGYWHRPSDVLAAVAVVTGWSAVACLLLVVPAPAVLQPDGAASTDGGPRRRTTTWALVLLLAAALVSAVALVLVVVALSGTPGGLHGGVHVVGSRAHLLGYGGGVLATVGGVCAMVAAQLALRAAAGRVGAADATGAVETAGADETALRS